MSVTESTLSKSALDYAWPLSREDELAGGWEFYSSMIALTESLLLSNKNYGRALHVCLFDILNEFLCIRRHLIVAQHLGVAHPMIQDWTGRIAGAIARGTAPDFHPNIARLRHPLPRIGFARHAFRKMRSRLSGEPFARYRAHSAIDSGATVVLGNSALVRQSAAFERKRVAFCDYRDWFQFSPETMPQQGSAISQSVAVTIADLAQNHLGDACKLRDDILLSLKTWLSVLVELCAWHLNRIEADGMVPRRLWGGSLNFIILRLIRRATQDQGGEILLHDHGEGIGAFWSPEDLPGRFDLTHRYATYNSAMARRIADRAKFRDLLPDSRTLRFEGLPGAANLPIILAERQPSEPKRIMLVRTVIPRDNLSLNCIPAAPVQLDFHARLFAELEKWGFEILDKPHPGSRVNYCIGFAESFSGTTVTKNFEDVANEPDVIIFDFISSSIRRALLGDRGIVLIDYGINRIDPLVLPSFLERVVVVKASFAPNNKLQISWEELRSAIETSWKKRKNFVCADLIYGAGNLESLQ